MKIAGSTRKDVHFAVPGIFKEASSRKASIMRAGRRDEAPEVFRGGSREGPVMKEDPAAPEAFRQGKCREALDPDLEEDGEGGPPEDNFNKRRKKLKRPLRPKDDSG